MTGLFAPLVLLAIVLAADLWVYVDARRCAAAGSPVFLRIGAFTMESPVAWLVACLVFWVLFFPVYLVSRSRS